VLSPALRSIDDPERNHQDVARTATAGVWSRWGSLPRHGGAASADGGSPRIDEQRMTRCNATNTRPFRRLLRTESLTSPMVDPRRGCLGPSSGRDGSPFSVVTSSLCVRPLPEAAPRPRRLSGQVTARQRTGCVASTASAPMGTIRRINGLPFAEHENGYRYP
jgi:hypothetical protein